MDPFKNDEMGRISGRRGSADAAGLGPPAQPDFFKYVAGTESLPKDCMGKLEVTDSQLVFRCAETSVSIAYGDITEMEFQPQVSKKIRKMKLGWTIKPTSARGKHKGFSPCSTAPAARRAPSSCRSGTIRCVPTWRKSASERAVPSRAGRTERSSASPAYAGYCEP